MSGWNHTNANWAEKTCAACGNTFTPKSGAHKFCTPECKGKWKYITGVASTENQYKKISGDWERYVSRLLYFNGRKRDQLTREIILKKLEEQNYRCALTGYPLTCKLEKGTRCMTNASIDRIEAGGAYIENNIRIVCRAVNSWRSDLPTEEFIAWCQAVVDYAKEHKA